MSMKAAADCIECMFRQALNTARQVTDDKELQAAVLSKLRENPFDLNQTPAAFSQPVYAAVSEILGVDDPYSQEKKDTNEAAMELIPTIREIIALSDDPLDGALHAAVAGNIIDLGIGSTFDLATDIESIMKQDFAINHIADLRKELESAKTVLYLGDNAGEIVLDTLLIQNFVEAGKHVTFTVKSGPIINDATMEDAVFAGIPDLAKVIETGSNDIGVNWDNVSEEFLDAFSNADIIISKGHGNFETCVGREENLFFLLKTKCQLVANELNVPLGSIVLSHRGTTD